MIPAMPMPDDSRYADAHIISIDASPCVPTLCSRIARFHHPDARLHLDPHEYTLRNAPDCHVCHFTNPHFSPFTFHFGGGHANPHFSIFTSPAAFTLHLSLFTFLDIHPSTIYHEANGDEEGE